MLDLVEAEIEDSQVVKLFQALGEGNKVIVEVELRQRLGNIGRELNASYLVLTETYSLKE